MCFIVISNECIMVYRDDILRHDRIAKHALVQREKSRVSQALVPSSSIDVEASSSSWFCVSAYYEDMLCAFSFSLLRGNQVTDSFRLYLDHLVAEDMHFNTYIDHRETRKFNDIVLYS